MPRAPTARALRQNREGLTRTASGERALLQTLQQRLVGKDPCFFFGAAPTFELLPHVAMPCFHDSHGVLSRRP